MWSKMDTRRLKFKFTMVMTTKSGHSNEILQLDSPMHQYDILENVFATPVLFPNSNDNSNIAIIVTQSSSLFFLQTDTLQLLWYIRIDDVRSFPRPPEIPRNDEHLFIQDSSGTLLAIKGLRNMMERNAMDLGIPTMKIMEILRITGETFGGVRILKMEKTDSNSNGGSNNEKTAVIYRAFIGSRDDRMRCFYFSL